MILTDTQLRAAIRAYSDEQNPDEGDLNRMRHAIEAANGKPWEQIVAERRAWWDRQDELRSARR